MLGTLHIFIGCQTSASPLDVWAALEAAPRWPEVQHDLIEARIEPDEILAPGAAIRVRARPGTRARDKSYRVIEGKKPCRLVIESGSTEFRARTSYKIEGSPGGGARVSITSEVQPVWWLHKITTEISRRFYTRELTAATKPRLRAMLTLAERIAAERV